MTYSHPYENLIHGAASQQPHLMITTKHQYIVHEHRTENALPDATGGGNQEKEKGPYRRLHFGPVADTIT